MFWKKKNNAEDLIFFESNEARGSFRICPSPEEPITTAFQGKCVLVENIGATGIAFRDQGFRPGQSQSMVFDLPGENRTISATVRIVDINVDGMCHGQFIGLSEDDCNAIHRYMLAAQIRQVRMKRQALPVNTGQQKSADIQGRALTGPVPQRPKASDEPTHLEECAVKP